MLNDGLFHQAAISLNKQVLIRLVVEKRALKTDHAGEWEWMAWRTAGSWGENVVPISGRALSLNMAKRQAFDTAISMLAELARDRPTSLLAPFAMCPHEHWRTDVAVERH